MTLSFGRMPRILRGICPILTSSKTPYQNHKGSTARKDPISATNHKWEVSHLWKSSLSSELRYYLGANTRGAFNHSHTKRGALMNAEIIAVGSELLLGQIVNTNARFLSSH